MVEDRYEIAAYAIAYCIYDAVQTKNYAIQGKKEQKCISNKQLPFFAIIWCFQPQILTEEEKTQWISWNEYDSRLH